MSRFFSSFDDSKTFCLGNCISVSKQLIKSKRLCSSEYFDLTLYSFGDGEGITWQTMPGDIILYVVQGRAVFEVDAENGGVNRFEAKCADAIFVQSGKRFQISGCGEYKLLFMIVNKGEKDMFIKNFEQGKVVELKKQIEVEAGTIVSKTLVNSNFMTMTLFAFDAGQGVSTHAAPGDAFVVCLEGKAEVELNGEKLSIREGESLIMPANAPHAVKAVEPYKMLLTVVKA